jgi:hypothetical protein
MRLTSLVRRSVALTATTALMTGGLATGMLTAPAFAAEAITQVSPDSANNNTTPSITLTTGTATFRPSGDSVVLHPTFTGSSVGDIPAPVDGADNPFPELDTPSNTITIQPDLTLAAPGSYDIIVTQTPTVGDPTFYQCNGCFHITSFAPASVQLVRAGASTGANARGLGALDLTGSYIAKGATVEFLTPGTNDVDPKLTFTPGDPNNASTGGYISGSVLRGNYSYQTGVLPGVHEVRITNTDHNTSGVRGTMSQPVFAAQSPLSPSSIGAGASQKLLTITGQGFTTGSSLAIQRLSNDTDCPGEVTVGTVQVNNNGGTLSAPVSFAACAPAGARAVTVTGVDGGYYSLAGALTTTPAPTVTNVAGVAQKAFGRGADVADVTINGTGFSTGATSAQWPTFTVPGNPGVTLTTISASATAAHVHVVVGSEALLGTFQVKVTNPDGGSTTTTASTPPLAVTPAPVEKTISDPSAFPGDQVNVVMTGTGFAAGSMTVQPYFGTNADGSPKLDNTVGIGTVNVTKGQNGADDSASFTITVSSNALPGLRDLKLLNTNDNGSSMCVGCFGIDSLAVQDTAGSPPIPIGAAAAGNGTHRLRFFGQGITSATTLELFKVGDPDYQPHLVGTPIADSITSTYADASIDLTGAAPGLYNAVATLSTNPLVTLSCSSCFRINGIAASNVTLSPTSGGRGAVDRLVTFQGTGFSRGMIVTISGATADVTYHPASGATPAYLTALVDIASDAATGPRDVVLRTADGQNPTTLSNAFTVNEGPVPNGNTPAASFGQGAGSEPASPTTITLTVKGTGFVVKSGSEPGSTLDVGPGIAVSNVNVVKGTTCGALPTVPPCTPTDDTLTANLVVSPSATTGARSITVVNSDGGRGVLNGKLTITAGPKVTSVSPVSFAPGATQQAFTINGSGFAAGSVPQIRLGDGTIDPKVTLGNVTVVDATKITAVITVASDAVRGTRTVAVLNTDKGYGGCAQCLTIATVPSAPRNLALVSGSQSLSAFWTAPADNGGAAVTKYVVSAYRGATFVTSQDVAAPGTSALIPGLANGVTYTVRVVAVNVAGNSTPASTTGIPGKAVTLTNAASVRVVTAGTAMRFTGRLTSGATSLAGRVVTLRFTPSVGAAFTRSTTTTSTGTWSYRFVPTYTFSMVATYAGDATYRPASSVRVPVTVATRVTRTSPSATPYTTSSTSVRIAGTVSPNKRGKVVYLYRYVGTSRTLIGRATVTSTSTYAFALRLSRGTYTLRVYIPTTTGNLYGYSSAFVIKRV